MSLLLVNHAQASAKGLLLSASFSLLPAFWCCETERMGSFNFLIKQMVEIFTQGLRCHVCCRSCHVGTVCCLNTGRLSSRSKISLVFSWKPGVSVRYFMLVLVRLLSRKPCFWKSLQSEQSPGSCVRPLLSPVTEFSLIRVTFYA